MKRLLTVIIATTLVGMTAVSVDASLVTIGTATYGATSYNLIYDDTPGLIWLDYSNPGDSWQNQVNWVADLTGALTYNIKTGYSVTWGSTNWRLPDIKLATENYIYGYNGTTSGGFNITSGEMGHLNYTELGNSGYVSTNGIYPQTGWGLTNKSYFANLQPYYYWSSLEYTPNTNLAWYFNFSDGDQGAFSKNNPLYAMAVRPGNFTPVPEPGTIMLMSSGMLGLAFWRKRRGKFSKN